MKSAIILATTIGLSLAAGCQGSFTGIRPLDANSYVLTRTITGAFGVPHGSLLRCTPQPNGDLSCVRIAVP